MLISCVRPGGVRDTRASCFWLARALISDDLPTFDRPTKPPRPVTRAADWCAVADFRKRNCRGRADMAWRHAAISEASAQAAAISAARRTAVSVRSAPARRLPSSRWRSGEVVDGHQVAGEQRPAECQEQPLEEVLTEEHRPIMPGGRTIRARSAEPCAGQLRGRSTACVCVSAWQRACRRRREAPVSTTIVILPRCSSVAVAVVEAPPAPRGGSSSSTRSSRCRSRAFGQVEEGPHRAERVSKCHQRAAVQQSRTRAEAGLPVEMEHDTVRR